MNRLKKILKNLKEQQIDRKFERFPGKVVFIDTRGIGFPEIDDARFIIVNDSSETLVRVFWYSSREEMRKDVGGTAYFHSKAEFFSLHSEYYDVHFEEDISVFDILLSYRNHSGIERLEELGAIDIIDYGRVDEFKRWLRGKEYDRDYIIYLDTKGGGEVHIDDLASHFLGAPVGFFDVD